MKSPIVQGVAVAVLVVMVSLVTLNSLFFPKERGINLEAKLIRHEDRDIVQGRIINQKLDHLKELVLKIGNNAN